MYSFSKGRAAMNKKIIKPIPDLRATRTAVRTTLSASSDLSPARALALEYKLVVATFKNAKR